MTVAELYAGVREGRERLQLERLRFAFEIVAIDDQIAQDAGMLRKRFGKFHGTGLTDAIIAASTLTVRARLVTHNAKHFPMFDDLIVPYP